MRKDVGVDGDAQRISQLVLDVLPQDHRRSGPGTGTACEDDYRSPIPERPAVAHLGGRPRGHHRRRRCWTSSTTTCSRRSRTCQSPARPATARRVVRDVFEDAYNYMKSGQLMRQVINKINERRLQQPDRAPALRRHLRADPQRPAKRRQRGRVLHAARRHRLHGRPRSTRSPAKSCSTPPAAPAAS